MLVGALEADRVANLGLLLIAGLVIVAFVVSYLARAVVVKVVVAAALLGLGALVWTQRADLQDCAERLGGLAAAGGTPPQCKFLGLKVDVSPP